MMPCIVDLVDSGFLPALELLTTNAAVGVSNLSA